jgi:hypothetical protein
MMADSEVFIVLPYPGPLKPPHYQRRTIRVWFSNDCSGIPVRWIRKHNASSTGIGAAFWTPWGIEAAESRTDTENSGLETVKRPAGIPVTYTDHAKLIFDMMHLAYLTDMTQVVTVMMGHEGGNRTFVEMGFKEGHHSLSHHRGLQDSIETLKQIDHYQNELIAYFLEKMQSTKEVDGSTLLDNSMIVAGSPMSDGNTHVHYDLPTVVFGGAQGRLKAGRHIRYDNEPFSNLHLFTIDAFGASKEMYVEGESDATGILKGLA